MTAFLFLAVLVALIVLGMPIRFAMALLPIVYIAMTDIVPLTAVPYQLYSALE